MEPKSIPTTLTEAYATHKREGLDARIENHGTIFLVRPLTNPAFAWLAEHTEGHWFGNALVVEHRFVADLVYGLRDAGFRLEAA